MTKNTGVDWREIGGNGRENDQKGRKREKKNESGKKNWGLESGQKKMTMKWATQLTHITSCRKIPRDKET